MGEEEEDKEWEELIESAPRPYERLGRRMVADPAAPWRDLEARERIGLLLAFALGVEFFLEKKLFRKAAAKLLASCRGDVEGLESTISDLFRTNWLIWARQQNSPYSLLLSIRRAWRRESFLFDEKKRKVVEGLLQELARKLDLKYEQVAFSCLNGLVTLLELYGEEKVETAFSEILCSDFPKWMKTFGASPKAFLSRVKEYLMFEDSFEYERDWEVSE